MPVTNAPIPIARIIAGSAVTLLARLRHPSTGSLLVPADVSGVSIEVIDSEAATGTTRTLTIGDVVKDTPQTWSVDAEGYNLGVVVLGSEIPTDGTSYSIAVTVTLTDTNAVRQLWRLQTVDEPESS